MIPLVFLALLAIAASGATLTAHWLAVAFCLLWPIAALAGAVGDRQRRAGC